MAAAMGEGLASVGRQASEAQARCDKGNGLNEAEANYCKHCGTALGKTVRCPVCDELNDPDARFGDASGKAMPA